MQPTPGPLESKDSVPAAPTDNSPLVAHTAGQVFTPTTSAATVPAVPAEKSTLPAEPPAASPPAAERTLPPVNVQPQTQVITGGLPTVRQPKPKKRRLFVSAAALILLLGGSAAAYFGYYVPNKPENVWNSALVNTGKGYDKLSQFVVDQLQSSHKGWKLEGKFKVTGAVAADGTFKGAADKNNSRLQTSLSAAGTKLNIEARTLKSNAGSPDLYFKADGLKDLGKLFGGEDYAQMLSGVDGHWYFIDHSLLDQYASQNTGKGLDISAADVNELLKAVGGATKEYALAADPDKAAFSVKHIVGKEQQDGRSVYHYKVGVNKANFKIYTTHLCDSLAPTKIYKLLSGGRSAEQAAKECKDTSDVDKWDETSTVDVWVDRRTKLIHKIRFTDKTNKDNYLDVGQDYQGGDELPFNLAFHYKTGGSTSIFNLNLKLNMKTNALALSGSLDQPGKDAENGTFSLNISPSDSAVKVTKPSGARTFTQLLNDLGFGDQPFSTPSTAPAKKPAAKPSASRSNADKDAERKTDINALQGQLEVYNAINGYYPSLAQVNNPTWRAKNMHGFDNNALQDPDSSSQILAASPAKRVYAYQTSPASCDGGTKQCTSYTLTATLSDGSKYSKQSLI